MPSTSNGSRYVVQLPADAVAGEIYTVICLGPNRFVVQGRAQLVPVTDQQILAPDLPRDTILVGSSDILTPAFAVSVTSTARPPSAPTAYFSTAEYEPPAPRYLPPASLFTPSESKTSVPTVRPPPPPAGTPPQRPLDFETAESGSKGNV